MITEPERMIALELARFNAVWTLVMEGKLHERYHTKRVRGEWFKLSRKDISAIQKELVV